ncbi:uncharacterized protein LOC144346068 [Saccoglossus kowalevskii]
MWRLVKQKYSLNVFRQTIAKLMRALDPEGVEMRSKKRFKKGLCRSVGPNQTWHMDGYDKLKPYGVCISGCIDGYSRKNLWVKAASTNSDPSVIAHYYLNCVDEITGCPLQIRTDPGTENGTVAVSNSPLLFRNTTNRIVSSDNTVEKSGIRRSFMYHVVFLIYYITVLNYQYTHKFFLNIPRFLFSLHIIDAGGRDMIQPVTTEEVRHHAHTPNYVGDEQIDEYIDHAMKCYKLLPPKTPEQAKHLYCQLKAMVEADSQ